MQKREVSDLYGILTLYYVMCVCAYVYVRVHACMCLKMLLHVFLQHSTSHTWKHILSIEPSTCWLSYLLSQGSSISAFMPFWHLPECRISKLHFVYLSVKRFFPPSHFSSSWHFNVKIILQTVKYLLYWLLVSPQFFYVKNHHDVIH